MGVTGGPIRRDPPTGRRVFFAPQAMGPADYRVDRHVKRSPDCPFCPGREAMTPRETFRIGDPWRVRVVPNRYAAVAPDEPAFRETSGLFERMGGRGVHEVIVEHPDHHIEMADFKPEDMRAALGAYRRRWRDLAASGGHSYAMIFKNYGAAAGASLEHTHAQLVALPFVPARAQDEIGGSVRHHAETGRCVWCGMIDEAGETRLVARNASFVAICPEASRFPFETMILPAAHAADFAATDDVRLGDFADLLRDVLARLKARLDDPPFNFIIHSLPLSGGPEKAFHWHLELIPKLARTAAFEWGTGFYVNPTPPEEAARVLRG